ALFSVSTSVGESTLLDSMPINESLQFHFNKDGMICMFESQVWSLQFQDAVFKTLFTLALNLSRCDKRVPSHKSQIWMQTCHTLPHLSDIRFAKSQNL